jgi:bifunctional non-homologous end joining protein LigD
MKAVAGDLPTGDGWAFEIKWDGMRIVTFVDDGEVRLQAASGKDATLRFPELAALGAMLEGHSVILDGEVVAFDDSGRPGFGLLQPRMHTSSVADSERLAADIPICYEVFDLLHLDGNDATALPYDDRRRLLEHLIEPGPWWDIPASHTEDGEALLEAARTKGLEGLVAKRRDSVYEPGKRSRAWRKVKIRNEQELVVGGWAEGEGSRRGRIGGLLVGYYDDGALHYAGRVGSGLTGSELVRLSERFEQLASDESPFDPPPPRQFARHAHWLRPEVVVQVAFAEWTGDGRLRHPSYLGERDDKDPREVTREPGATG